MMQTSTEVGTTKAPRRSEAKRMTFRDMARLALSRHESDGDDAVKNAIDELSETILGDQARYADMVNELVRKGISSEVKSIISSNRNAGLKAEREERGIEVPPVTEYPAAATQAAPATVNTRPAHGGSQSASVFGLLRDSSRRLMDIRLGKRAKRLGDMVWSDLDEVSGQNEKRAATTAANARFLRRIQAGLNDDRVASVESRYTDAALQALLEETGATVDGVEKNGDADA